MRPFPAGLMRMWPISTRVNKPGTTIPRLSTRSKWQSLDAESGILDQFLEPDDLRHLVAVERQVETGTDTNLKNSTCRVRYNAAAIRREPALPHGKMYQPRDD